MLSWVVTIEETMSGLIENGVFELAEEDQDKFCCNINIVAKPNKNIRSSKADKHIKRMSATSSSQSSNNNSGWRACFDFGDLNTITNH